MDRFMKLARRAMNKDGVLSDERGLTTVEYVIILVLIAVLAIGVWRTFGGSVKAQVTNSTTEINSLGTGESTTGTTPAATPDPGPK